MTAYSTRAVLRILRPSFGLVAATEIWVVAALVAATIPLTHLLPLTLIFAAAYWIVRWIAYGRPAIHTPADLAIILLLATLPIALWMTPLLDTTREQILRLLSGVALYYAVANWSNSRLRLRLLFNGLPVTGIALACSALVSVRWGAITKLAFIPASLYDRLPLLVVDFVNQNVMAGALVILLPMVVTFPLFAASSVRWFEWPIILLALATMVGILVLTQSRGGLLAFCAAMTSLIILRWHYGYMLVITLMVLTSGVLYTGWDLAQLQGLASASTYGGLDSRFEIWSRAWYMIQDYPLTGVGMGAFKPLLDTAYPLFLSNPTPPHAHNLLLQIAVDLGIPGLMAWLTILLLVTRGAWRVYRAGRAYGDAWVAGLGAGLIASQVALMTHGMVDAVTWGMVRTAVLVWVLWGLAAASERILVTDTKRPLPQHGSVDSRIR